MEPSQIILGGAEECHSSESGWTMYIGSPIEEDGHCDIEDEDNDEHYGGTQADPEVESDDSMASDASSRPSHYGINHLGNGERGYGLTHFKQKVEEEYDEDEYFSDHKKANKNKKESQIAEKRGEKKEMAFLNSKGKALVQGGGKVKVRKNNHWVGTRK